MEHLDPILHQGNQQGHQVAYWTCDDHQGESPFAAVLHLYVFFAPGHLPPRCKPQHVAVEDELREIYNEGQTKYWKYRHQNEAARHQVYRATSLGIRPVPPDSTAALVQGEAASLEAKDRCVECYIRNIPRAA